MILCFAWPLLWDSLIKTRVLAHERAIAEPSCKQDTCCPDDDDHNCSCVAHGSILRRRFCHTRHHASRCRLKKSAGSLTGLAVAFAVSYGMVCTWCPCWVLCWRQ